MLELEKLKTFIENLLEFKGVCKECEKEQPLWQHLYHLYLAAAIYAQMSEGDKKTANSMQKRLSGNFARINVKIKQKKRKRKDEKEKISPTPPLIKEKEEKEKKEKDEETTHTILVESDFSSKKEYLEYRQEQFKNECLARKDIYGEKACLAFYDYWREKSTRRWKMRFELQTAWDIDIRMEQWKYKSFQAKDEAAKISLENAKRMKAKQETVTQQQAAVAEIREDANAKLEREIAERKQGAVSYEEYLKMKDEKLKMKSTQKEPSLLCKN